MGFDPRSLTHVQASCTSRDTDRDTDRNIDIQRIDVERYRSINIARTTMERTPMEQCAQRCCSGFSRDFLKVGGI